METGLSGLSPGTFWSVSSGLGISSPGERSPAREHTSTHISSLTFRLCQSGCSVGRHVQLPRKLKIIIEFDCSLSDSGNINMVNSTGPSPTHVPLPVIIKSLQLNDQDFGQSTDAESLHSVYLQESKLGTQLRCLLLTFLSHFSQ